jgi:hypothetical protein
MRFKAEVRQFMTDYYNWRKKKDVTISILRTHIREQDSRIDDLMNRLLARDLPELKTFTMPRIEPLNDEDYVPEEDEGLAGEIVMLPQK